jgi:hypothetical protein
VHERAVPVLAIGATAVILVLLAGECLAIIDNPARLAFTPGGDLGLYRDAATGWLHGQSFYLPAQLSGPYDLSINPRLYPPPSLLLFAAFTVLPWELWWAIPLGATGWALWRLSPRVQVWPILALCIWWPPSLIHIVAGNPVIWSLAALALGTVYAWPSVLAALKLSLGPFAFFGIWRRSWWVAAAGVALVSLAFAPMWPDYVRALLNARGLGIGYSIQEVPLMSLPIVAWAARDRRSAHGTDLG